jgi:hypothetical protein
MNIVLPTIAWSIFDFLRKIDKWLFCLSESMENFDYVEWVPMGNLVKGLVAMFICLEFFISFTILYFGGLSAESFVGVTIAWVVLVFIGFLIWNYRGLRSQVSHGRLTVVYGMFNKKSFSLDELTYCKRTKSNLGRYFGIGIRYGSDGSVAYTTSFGDAVEVTPKEGKVFVFSSKQADQVCEAIKNQCDVNVNLS